MKNQLLKTVVISLLLLTAVPVRAKNLQQNNLKNTEVIVRDSLILKGIGAYKIGNYQKAILLLKNSLNRKKVVVTSLEIQGFEYLALAYQKVGKQSLAEEIVDWRKFLLQFSFPESISTQSHCQNC